MNFTNCCSGDSKDARPQIRRGLLQEWIPGRRGRWRSRRYMIDRLISVAFPAGAHSEMLSAPPENGEAIGVARNSLYECAGSFSPDNADRLRKIASQEPEWHAAINGLVARYDRIATSR